MSKVSFAQYKEFVSSLDEATLTALLVLWQIISLRYTAINSNTFASKHISLSLPHTSHSTISMSIPLTRGVTAQRLKPFAILLLVFIAFFFAGMQILPLSLL